VDKRQATEPRRLNGRYLVASSLVQMIAGPSGAQEKAAYTTGTATQARCSSRPSVAHYSHGCTDYSGTHAGPVVLSPCPGSRVAMSVEDNAAPQLFDMNNPAAAKVDLRSTLIRPIPASLSDR
jgi:hypothetical protein